MAGGDAAVCARCCMRCGPSGKTPRASDGPPGRIGMQQFAEVGAGIERALAAEGRVAALRFSVADRRAEGPCAGRTCSHSGPRDLFGRSDSGHCVRALIELRREEVTAIPEDVIVIIATGPLTSDALAENIAPSYRVRSACFFTTASVRLWKPIRSTRASPIGPRVTANRPTAPTIT